MDDRQSALLKASGGSMVVVVLGVGLLNAGTLFGLLLIVLALIFLLVVFIVAFYPDKTPKPGELTPGTSTFKLVFNTPNKKGTVRVNRAWFDQAQVRTLDGATFELWVAEALRRQGWSVEVTPTSGDYGADLIATKDGQRTAVQVKRYAKHVGVSAVQQVMGGAAHWKCSGRMVVTSAPNFTPAAKTLASTTGTVLVTGKQLQGWRHTRGN